MASLRTRSLLKASCSFFRWTRHNSTISALQAAFRDPSSPFHIAPGTQGPASPDEPPSSAQYSTSTTSAKHEVSPAEAGRRLLTDHGHDPESFWEQTVQWGEHDSFQHVNNVNYLRYLESGRIHWMLALGREIGGPQKAKDMMSGKGVSLILKSVSLNYKRPVTYPDTLLIGHKPHVVREGDNTQFGCKAIIYSYAQQKVVTTSDSTLVWYDYDRLCKTEPDGRILDVLQRRMRLEV
ncbi:hypothetical protein PLEOSDRAFT_1113077 [Pleurotus ostreatus PC15]|uniref:Thioesterase domain-containing protein n=1 Tax=Pleurotus ostreatus (strain PC15) TaxID=1137138 RepID=A0A067NQT1_PLEO1|nr:hypothetical protein PLEOSDRAFT_1113077 [Pleurotus ostreatus PC15]